MKLARTLAREPVGERVNVTCSGRIMDWPPGRDSQVLTMFLSQAAANNLTAPFLILNALNGL